MLLSVTEVNIYYKSINFTGHILLLLQLIVIDLWHWIYSYLCF